MLERLERELMLIARCSVLAPRDRSEDRLERSAYLLLSRLDAEGALTLGEFADALHLDVSTVNRQTRALLRCGLVERIPDPAGGLARKLRITAVGAERLAAEGVRRRAELAGLLDDWSPQEVDRFADALTRFNREIEAREGRPGWPREA